MTSERDQAAISANTRELEPDIVTDFSHQLSYCEYLALDDVLMPSTCGPRPLITMKCCSSSSTRPANSG